MTYAVTAHAPLQGRVFGVLVTYRRPNDLRTMLARLAAQECAFAAVFVIDNGDAEEVRDAVNAYAHILRARYVRTPENLGPVGGFALGMQFALGEARDDDWILLLDDDDPPPVGAPQFLAGLTALASRLVERDPRTGAVGAGGGTFDARRGRIERVHDRDLAEAVPVTCMGNSVFPLYRAAAVRTVGVQDGRLFFGFGELEYGLRLEAAGYRLYLAGSFCRQRRAGRAPKAHRRPAWRRYYGVRNLVHLLRSSGHPFAAVRIVLGQGVIRPLVDGGQAGGSRLDALRLALHGARDGWRGRLGRVVEPVVADGAASGNAQPLTKAANG